jgi:hypothetical protein
MSNLEIYNKYRAVPKEAQKEIRGGRLRGMTDINPMWRIKSLTEQFGPCGIGWVVYIKNRWLDITTTGETVVNVEVGLKIKHNGEWSEEIIGIGGSMLVSNEKQGLYTNDEAYKMAYTDAISVACKALGFGADIYWQKDTTKYAEPAVDLSAQMVKPVETKLSAIVKCRDCGNEIVDVVARDGSVWGVLDICEYSSARFGRHLCLDCQKKAAKAK